MNCNNPAFFLSLLQDLYGILIMYHLTISHIYLKAFYTVFQKLIHFFQPVIIHFIWNYPVKAVIYYCFSVSQFMIMINRIMKCSSSRSLSYMIYNRCSSSARCRNCSCSEVIAGNSYSHIKMKVCMYVNSSGDNIFPVRIYNFRILYIQIFSYLFDNSVLNINIPLI